MRESFQPSVDSKPDRTTRSPTALERTRSSTHATVHGLRSMALVMPGERVADYRHHAAAWHVSLPSSSPAEALLVNQLADGDWKLARLTRIEHAQHLQAVEDAVKKTPEYVAYSSALSALTAMNVLVAHSAAAAQLRPFPARLGGLKPFLLAAKGTFSLVLGVEQLDQVQVKALGDAIGALEDAVEEGKARSDHMAALHAAAEAIQGALVALTRQGEESLAFLRQQLAGEVVPDGPETKKIRRYRSEIEKSQQRLLGILGELRVQRQAAEAALEASGGKPVDIRLRVVR